jgi:AcrR family transcriptional regulator
MNKKVVSRGVSKAQWLEAGLEALAHTSFSALSIEQLAHNLGISKSGFYWHFKNRDELLRELLQYWIHEITEVVTVNEALLAMGPRERLLETGTMIFDYHLTRWELAFRQWAQEDAEVARTVRKANRMRMNFLLKCFHDLGFSGDDAEMRVMTLLAYMTWDMHMYDYISRKRRRSMIEARIDLLITPAAHS